MDFDSLSEFDSDSQYSSDEDSESGVEENILPPNTSTPRPRQYWSTHPSCYLLRFENPAARNYYKDGYLKVPNICTAH
jgi:hypothetical protein